MRGRRLRAAWQDAADHEQGGPLGRRRGQPRPEDLLGSLEARVMKVLWQRGEATVGDVLERLNAAGSKELAYNTVMSVMARLERKGFLERERAGRAFLYRPASTRDEFLASQASRAARQLLDEYGELGVAGFVQQVSDDPALRAEIDRLLAEAEADER